MRAQVASVHVHMTKDGGTPVVVNTPQTVRDWVDFEDYLLQKRPDLVTYHHVKSIHCIKGSKLDALCVPIRVCFSRALTSSIYLIPSFYSLN